MRKLSFALISFLILILPLNLWAATRTIADGGGNWNSTSTWVEGAYPVAGDAVVATATSGNVTINTASACASIDLTNYTHDLKYNYSLTTTSTVTYPAGMTISGTADHITATTSTLSITPTMTGGLQLKGTSQTYTLGTNISINGTLTLSGATAITVNGNTLTVGGLVMTTATSGTTNIKMTGGSWSGAGVLKNNLEFAGNVSLSGQIYYNTGTLLYTSGTINQSTSILHVALATTFNTAGMDWYTIYIDANITITLASDLSLTSLLSETAGACTFSGSYNISTATWTIAGATSGTTTISGNVTASGQLTLSNSTATVFSGDFLITAGNAVISGSQTITLVHDVTINGATAFNDANVLNGAYNWRTAGLTTTGAVTGTATIVLTGGTWTGAGGACSTKVTFDGNVTLSGTILYAASGTPTLTYTSGTITVGTSILSIASSCTIAGGMSLYSLTITAAATLTINGGTLTGTGTLTGPNAAVTFAGDSGWTFATVANTAIATSAKTYTLTAGNTYTVTGAMNFSGSTAALDLTLASSHASNLAYFVLRPGASQDVGFLNVTRISAMGGQHIFSYKGDLTTAAGWNNVYYPPGPVGGPGGR